MPAAAAFLKLTVFSDVHAHLEALKALMDLAFGQRKDYKGENDAGGSAKKL